jgi:putative Mn2+ efflux pump MntP
LDAPTIAALALSLAADAFAAAVGIGLSTRDGAWRPAVRVGAHFGAFQAGMTLLGYAAGSAASPFAGRVGGYAAGGLLWLVAAHMAWEALHGRASSVAAPREQVPPTRRVPEQTESTARRGEGSAAGPDRGWRLVVVAVATSIDALGAGMGLGFVGAAGVWPAAAAIGTAAAVLPAGGVVLARLAAARLGKGASAAARLTGAAVLVAVGIRLAGGG